MSEPESVNNLFEVYLIGIIGAACIAWVACVEYDFWEDE